MNLAQIICGAKESLSYKEISHKDVLSINQFLWELKYESRMTQRRIEEIGQVVRRLQDVHQKWVCISGEGQKE